MDIWGRLYRDHWSGEAHPHVFHRDDGKRDTVASAAGYFVAPRGVADRAALDALGGRVLDLGCGPGSYARCLEERGVTVVAVDASPGAIAVCREHGCRDARVVEIDLVGPELGSFDAIICMGNTFGVALGPATLPERLSRMRSVLVPNGKLVLSLIDPFATTDPAHLAYHDRNRAAGRSPGLTRLRLEYRGMTSEWWDLWMPTEPELSAGAASTGWQIVSAVPEGNSRLYVLVPEP
jgi:SAM-dependent methyltransferase